MTEKRPSVLLVIEECDPHDVSVPLLGFRFFESLSKVARVTLATPDKNRKSLDKVEVDGKIVYISTPRVGNRYSRWVNAVTSRNVINWPVKHILTYPLYEAFNSGVFRRFSREVRAGGFDVVHAFPPVLPRYPVRLVNACGNTPFVLGPVNGGLQFPAGFAEIARKEFDYLNFLRNMCKFIPYYMKTYRRADRILVGSRYTRNLLRRSLRIDAERLQWFPENGVSEAFFKRAPYVERDGAFNLLFVGRLVPCKCADVVVRALSLLKKQTGINAHLWIVGDGPEKSSIEREISALGLTDAVTMTGLVRQSETIRYYRRSDVFCFPSIREFGGAVVLEAMACGLPCIVADNGGIAEYVTEGTGYKIKPISKMQMATEIARKIEVLIRDETLRKGLSAAAVERAKGFSWEANARRLTDVYHNVLKLPPEGGNS